MAIKDDMEPVYMYNSLPFLLLSIPFSPPPPLLTPGPWSLSIQFRSSPFFSFSVCPMIWTLPCSWVMFMSSCVHERDRKALSKAPIEKETDRAHVLRYFLERENVCKYCGLKSIHKSMQPRKAAKVCQSHYHYILLLFFASFLPRVVYTHASFVMHAAL